MEKTQFIFFVPPNEELEGTLHPQKFECTPKNEGKRVHVPPDDKTCGHAELYTVFYVFISGFYLIVVCCILCLYFRILSHTCSCMLYFVFISRILSHSCMLYLIIISRILSHSCMLYFIFISRMLSHSCMLYFIFISRILSHSWLYFMSLFPGFYPIVVCCILCLYFQDFIS